MSSHIKQQITSELDRRLKNLREHQFEAITVHNADYQELTGVFAKLIGVPLIKEIESIKEYVESL
jgi:hypothetical protein